MRVGPILLGLSFCLGACAPEDLETSSSFLSSNAPHRPGRGPWFEGWYARITDAERGVSFAVVVGSHVPRGERRALGEPLPGYAGVLIQDQAAGPLESHAFFSEVTVVEPSGADGFTWSAEGLGRVSDSGVGLEIPGRLRVSVELGARRPWNPRAPDHGPEGALGALPSPLHWYVHSLGSPSTYRIERSVLGSWRTLEGSGAAHLEKNWGRQFPSAWIWVQGLEGEGETALVMSGGRLAGMPEVIEPWLVGYRSSTLRWDFSPASPGTFVTRTFSPCEGRLSATIRDPQRTLVVEASAPPETFGPIAVPTADGFLEAGAEESFTAELVITAYEHDPLGGVFGQERFIERTTLRGAALEFGGGFRCGSAGPHAPPLPRASDAGMVRHPAHSTANPGSAGESRD